VLDALVNRKNGKVAGVGEPTVPDEGLQASQDLVATIGIGPYFFHMAGRRECAKRGFVDDGLVIQQGGGFVAQYVEDFFRCHGFDFNCYILITFSPTGVAI
jgi:hypothetical protein